MRKYIVEFHIPGTICIEAESNQEAADVFRKQYQSLSKSAVFGCPVFSEIYAAERAPLERLYNLVNGERAINPDSSAWVRMSLQCMEDPLFISTANNYKAGIEPDDTELADIIFNICSSIYLYYHYAEEGDKGFAFKEEARSILAAVKALHPEYDCWEWSGI